MLSELKEELKAMLIRECNLMDVAAEDIKDDMILFGAGDELGLDSIDYLQVCMVLSTQYGIKIKVAEYRTTFLLVMRDINTMADYVSKHRGEVKT